MNGIEWLHNNRDVQTVALISFPGEYGGDGDAGARMAIEQLGLEIVYDGAGQVTPPSADNPNPDWSGVIQQIVDADPDLVWATINPTDAGDDHGRRRRPGLRRAVVGQLAVVQLQAARHRGSPRCSTSTTSPRRTSVTWGEDVPGMAEVVEEMTAARPDLAAVRRLRLRLDRGEITHAILEQAAANGDMTRAGIVAAANEVTVDFNGLAPTQTWAGEPNDYIVRESYMYDVDLDAFNLIPMGEGVGDTGSVLLEGPYTGELAANFTYEGPCFEPTAD